MTDSMPTLTMTVRPHEGRGAESVIAAVGEIDLGTVEALRERLLPAIEHGSVVLDLAGVTFCDSSGLRVLVQAQRRASARGTCLRLAGLATPVRRLLEITRADRLFAVFPDLDSALTDSLARTPT